MLSSSDFKQILMCNKIFNLQLRNIWSFTLPIITYYICTNVIYKALIDIIFLFVILIKQLILELKNKCVFFVGLLYVMRLGALVVVFKSWKLL